MLDRQDEARDPFLLTSSSADAAEDGSSERVSFFETLQQEIEEYGDLLLRENAVGALLVASSKMHLSLFNII